MSKTTLNYPVFDGEKILEKHSIVIENGVITTIGEAEDTDSNYLLIPGLIDSHTHISTEKQLQTMLKNGVTAACDVSAPASLVNHSKQFTIIPSAGMAMGVPNGRSYVKKAIEEGARYIKVLLFEPNLMPKAVLKSICQAAHENSLKVAVHATSVKAERMAVTCGADILLHVPMKEELPEAFAEELAENGIVVAPTLVMMETFAHSKRNGYIPEHYQNAENAVRTLHRCGVTILAATDANAGDFAPPVPYGSSMHREMELLCRAGLSPIEVLASATGKTAQVFGIDGFGSVKAGKKANLLLIEGRPDKDITAVRNIRQIWINGEQIV